MKYETSANDGYEYKGSISGKGPLSVKHFADFKIGKNQSGELAKINFHNIGKFYIIYSIFSKDDFGNIYIFQKKTT